MKTKGTTGKGEAILVTGGAGYIGSHVVRDLGERGYRPVVLDNLSSGKPGAVLAGELVRGDVGDAELVGSLLRRHAIRSVMHFAAYIQVGESVIQPLKYYENNSCNCLRLIKACLENGVENFIFSSTAAVYGMPKKVPVDEKAALLPINPYGGSKLVSEMLLRDTAAANAGFRYVALRYFNAAGADRQARIGQDYRQPTHLLTRALQNRPGAIPVPGSIRHRLPHPRRHGDPRLHPRRRPRRRPPAGAGIFEDQEAEPGLQLRLRHRPLGAGRRRRRQTGHGHRFPGRPASPAAPATPPPWSPKTGLIRGELGWAPRVPQLDEIVASAWNWEKKLAATKKQ